MEREPARIRVILEIGEDSHDSYEAAPLELKDGDHIEDVLQFVYGAVNAIISEHLGDEEDE